MFISLAVLGTSGCSLNQGSNAPPLSTSTPQSLQGRVFGGQQPVVGATIQLYAAGAPAAGGGYGAGATPLIDAPLPTTNASGGFTFTYNLPSRPSYFYIVSTGGSPGSGNPANPDIVLMAAVSGCTAATTLPISYININEVTTAAAVMTLQPFIAAPTGTPGATVDIGAPAANSNDLRTAFQTASKLANSATGVVVNPTGSMGKLINTLGDILASCVNSDPFSSNNCPDLLTYATPSSKTSAGDTVQAGWYIAQNPAHSVSALFGLVPPSPPFVALSSAPASFAVAAPTDLVGCFEVLGGSAVTNTATSATVISGGDLGIYPTTGAAVTGFSFSTAPGSGIVTGAPATVHLADSIAENAQTDLTNAFSYAAGLSDTGSLLADIGNSTFTPGVYKNSGPVGFSAGTVTLDAQGDPDAVFIFQIGTTLTTAPGTTVSLINGAQPQNVFWQIGTSATIEASFKGTIMALDSITLASGIALQGRALASTAAVTLNDNAITAP
jgi:hypothetical protein